jgi:hypothetical protein
MNRTPDSVALKIAVEGNWVRLAILDFIKRHSPR